MFWNVRPIPRSVIACGGLPVTSSPSKTMRPAVGLYTPVNMLKKVVLPAPFGPIRLTIAARGIVKSTSFVATSPPNSLRTRSATSRLPFPLLMLRVVERRVVHAFVELGLPSRTRDQTLRPRQHHDHDDRAVDAVLVQRHLEIRPEGLVELVPDVREALLVQVGEERGPEHHAPNVAHAA